MATTPEKALEILAKAGNAGTFFGVAFQDTGCRHKDGPSVHLVADNGPLYVELMLWFGNCWDCYVSHLGHRIAQSDDQHDILAAVKQARDRTFPVAVELARAVKLEF